MVVSSEYEVVNNFKMMAIAITVLTVRFSHSHIEKTTEKNFETFSASMPIKLNKMLLFGCKQLIFFNDNGLL